MTLGTGADTAMRVDRSARTLRELALERLRDAILTFQFKPGERLVERVLCERLGVEPHRRARGAAPSRDRRSGRGHSAAGAGRGPARHAAGDPGLRDPCPARGRGRAGCGGPRRRRGRGAAKEANRAIQAAFATGQGHDILRTTTDFYELLFRIADKPVAWQVVQGLNARINQLRAMTVVPARARGRCRRRDAAHHRRDRIGRRRSRRQGQLRPCGARQATGACGAFAGERQHARREDVGLEEARAARAGLRRRACCRAPTA